MGRWGTIFFSEEIAQKESFKKTLKDPAEIEKVQKEIDELRRKEAEEKREEE